MAYTDQSKMSEKKLGDVFNIKISFSDIGDSPTQKAMLIGSLLSLATPGFELDGFPCLIGLSKAALDTSASVENLEVDKVKVKKASAQLRSSLIMADLGHLLPSGKDLLSNIDEPKLLRIVNSLMNMAESRHGGNLHPKIRQISAKNNRQQTQRSASSSPEESLQSGSEYFNQNSSESAYKTPTKSLNEIPVVGRQLPRTPVHAKPATGSRSPLKEHNSLPGSDGQASDQPEGADRDLEDRCFWKPTRQLARTPLVVSAASDAEIATDINVTPRIIPRIPPNRILSPTAASSVPPRSPSFYRLNSSEEKATRPENSLRDVPKIGERRVTQLSRSPFIGSGVEPLDGKSSAGSPEVVSTRAQVPNFDEIVVAAAAKGFSEKAATPAKLPVNIIPSGKQLPRTPHVPSDHNASDSSIASSRDTSTCEASAPTRLSDNMPLQAKDKDEAKNDATECSSSELAESIVTEQDPHKAGADVESSSHISISKATKEKVIGRESKIGKSLPALAMVQPSLTNGNSSAEYSEKTAASDVAAKSDTIQSPNSVRSDRSRKAVEESSDSTESKSTNGRVKGRKGKTDVKETRNLEKEPEKVGAVPKTRGRGRKNVLTAEGNKIPDTKSRSAILETTSARIEKDSSQTKLQSESTSKETTFEDNLASQNTNGGRKRSRPSSKAVEKPANVTGKGAVPKTRGGRNAQTNKTEERKTEPIPVPANTLPEENKAEIKPKKKFVLARSSKEKVESQAATVAPVAEVKRSAASAPRTSANKRASGASQVSSNCQTPAKQTRTSRASKKSLKSEDFEHEEQASVGCAGETINDVRRSAVGKRASTTRTSRRSIAESTKTENEQRTSNTKHTVKRGGGSSTEAKRMKSHPNPVKREALQSIEEMNETVREEVEPMPDAPFVQRLPDDIYQTPTQPLPDKATKKVRNIKVKATESKATKVSTSRGVRMKKVDDEVNTTSKNAEADKSETVLAHTLRDDLFTTPTVQTRATRRSTRSKV